MKYQHILNGKVLFETNDVSEFYSYLMTNKEAQFAKNSIFYNLLEKSGEYKCEMVKH